MPFNYLFFGFIFLLNFYLNGINVMPNTIAYILLTKGLSKLGHINKYFKRSWELSTVLIFLSIPNFLQIVNQLEFNGNLGFLLFNIIVVIINLRFMHNFCYGLDCYAEHCGYKQLENKAKFYYLIYVAQIIIYVLTITIPQFSKIGSVIILLFSTIYFICMVELIRKYYQITVTGKL